MSSLLAFINMPSLLAYINMSSLLAYMNMSSLLAYMNMSSLLAFISMCACACMVAAICVPVDVFLSFQVWRGSRCYPTQTKASRAARHRQAPTVHYTYTTLSALQHRLCAYSTAYEPTAWPMGL